MQGPVLPLEVVDLILTLSLANADCNLDPTASRLPGALASITQAARFCRISKHHRQLFTPLLYRHVVLLDAVRIKLFHRTVVETPGFGSLVRYLVLVASEGLNQPRLLQDPSLTTPTLFQRTTVDDYRGDGDAGVSEGDPTASPGPPSASTSSSASLPSVPVPPSASASTLTGDVEGAGMSPEVSRHMADRILSSCRNLTHLILSRDLFSDWSAGLVGLVRPREVSLIDVSRAADLDGLATRHRRLMTRVLENDPRIQAVLRPSDVSYTLTEHADRSHNPAAAGGFDGLRPARQDSDMQSHARPLSQTQQEQQQQQESVSLSAIDTLGDVRSAASSESSATSASRSLSHLHLINFDGRLLHHLATLSSITHLVLTFPAAARALPGVPGLAVLPRSHIMMLLGSGNISKIIVRADVPTCLRIMEELQPIEDAKLVFRPIRTVDDPLFQPRSSSSSRSSPSLSDPAAARRRRGNNVKQLDVLSEFFDRVKLDIARIAAARARTGRNTLVSSDDADDSRDSSGAMSFSRSSQSSDRDSRESEIYDAEADEDEDEEFDDEDDDYYDNQGPGFTQSPIAAGQSHAVPRTRDAPPLQIPIEELLRGETFRPAGIMPLPPHLQQLTQPALPTLLPPQQHHHQSELEQGSHMSGSEGNTDPSTSSRGSLRRMRRGPFAFRRSDFRGATQLSVDRCAELYDALAADAGVEQEMNFW